MKWPTKVFSLILLSLMALAPAYVVYGAMSSSNYKIPSDSLNSGGGGSVSSSYGEQDTIGEIATGDSASANYALHAGYQQMQVSYISISSPGNATLPTMSGITAGTSQTSSSWTVVTDNAAGYSMSVTASTSPALKGPIGAFFPNYSTGATPDYTFAVASGQSVFGFTPEGSDIVARFKDNGSACNTGSSDTADKCWTGFSTSPTSIAQSSSSNQPSGIATTIKYQAGVGTAKIQDAGTYTATITVTAVTL